MLRKLLIGWTVLVLVVVGTAWAIPAGTPAGTILRVTDGIGWQYKCVSSSIKNQYGFGGVADTLATDSTVSRGTIMNIHRVKEATDIDLSELLPIFISSRTQLDSSYIYNKWSAVCWGLNNFFSGLGGLSGFQQARSDSGRYSPYFARVARANGIYLAAKTTYAAALTFCSGSLKATDSTTAFADSAAIDSTLYGPEPYMKVRYTHGGSVDLSCTLKVYGSNQNLIHGRVWKCFINPEGAGHDSILAPAIAGDSVYNVDSIKMKKVTGTYEGWTFKIISYGQRLDSL
jgi:hypothetical protein